MQPAELTLTNTLLVGRARAGDRQAFTELVDRHHDLLLADLVDDPAWVAEEHELVARVRGAVQGLPSGQRAAVLLFYLAGLSQAETAVILGIPVGVVKTRLHKPRLHLRRDLWILWEDLEPMSTSTEHRTATGYVDVHVSDLRRVLPDAQWTIARHLVPLQETQAPGRILGIAVGAFECEAILMLLSDVEMPRPMTFTYANSLLQAAGGHLVEVRVNRLAEETFYATVRW
jgi:hypothetical protein